MPVEAAFAAKIVGDVIEDVLADLQQLSDNLALRMSSIGQDLLAQIRISAQELLRELRDQLDRTIAEIEEAVAEQVYHLTRAVRQLAEQLASDVGEITSQFALDLRQTISMTWFSDELYALTSIDGTLVPSPLAGDWTISATGLNLGYDSGDISSQVWIEVEFPNQNPLVVQAVEVSDTRVEFVLPRELLEDQRKERSIVLLPARLEVRIRKDRTFFDKKEKATQEFVVSLSPVVSGSFRGEASVPEFGWVTNPDLTKTLSRELPSGHATSSSDIVRHRRSAELLLPRMSSPAAAG